MEVMEPTHDCGMCDAPLLPLGTEGLDGETYATFVCSNLECNQWHISKDCCHPGENPMTALPMPGDRFQENLIVVASGWISDEEDECLAALLVVNPQTPGDYYNILEIEFMHEWQIIAVFKDFGNIVPATQAFHDAYDFWGG